ncbi:MAG: histidine phosphatase family protein [Pseudomonadota bacterium]
MEIIIYRHAKPKVSDKEIISGRDFPQWVQRYDESGIYNNKIVCTKEDVVYTSNLLRSIETGHLIGKRIIKNPLIMEAGIPLIRFPAVRLKAKKWLFVSRLLWILGFKTECESLADVKIRVIKAVDSFESQLSGNERVVIVGHGFTNWLIKRELLYRGWFLKQKTSNKSFLSKMIFETKSVV